MGKTLANGVAGHTWLVWVHFGAFWCVLVRSGAFCAMLVISLDADFGVVYVPSSFLFVVFCIFFCVFLASFLRLFCVLSAWLGLGVSECYCGVSFMFLCFFAIFASFLCFSS